MKKLLSALLIVCAGAFAQTNEFKSSNVKITGGSITGTTINIGAATGTSLALTGTVSAGAETGITAHAGGGQGSAYALSASAVTHNVTVVATTGDSVLLPASTPGQMHYIINSGASGVQVYGTGTDTINGVAFGTGVRVSPTNAAWFIADAAGTWYSTQAQASGTGLFLRQTSPTLITPALGVASATSIAVSGAVTMPGLATSSAATTGTMCWTTGTGNVNVDTTTTCLLSARKYKQDITPLNSGIDAVMRLRPVSYQLRPEVNPDHLGRQVGFIADEVAVVDDRLVAHDETGDVHAVRYQQITALLTAGMQDQQREIARLEFWLIMLAFGVFAYRMLQIIKRE